MRLYDKKKLIVVGWSSAVSVVIGIFTVWYMIQQGDFTMQEGNSVVAAISDARSRTGDVFPDVGALFARVTSTELFATTTVSDIATSVATSTGGVATQ